MASPLTRATAIETRNTVLARACLELGPFFFWSLRIVVSSGESSDESDDPLDTKFYGHGQSMS